MPLLLSLDENTKKNQILNFFSMPTIVNKAQITAKPALLSNQTIKQLAQAQEELIDPNRNELVLTDLILDSSFLVNTAANSQSLSVIANNPGDYYSAYIWILFKVVITKNQQVISNAEEWRDLLPFFEHINIANLDCYKLQKKVLAHKALESMKLYRKKFLEIEGQNGGDMKFEYVCGFDHCNCSNNSVPLIIPALQEGGLMRDTLIDLIKQEVLDVQKSIILNAPANSIGAYRVPKIINDMNTAMALSIGNSPSRRII